MEITTNRHERPMVTLSEVPVEIVADQFDYMRNSAGEVATDYISEGETPRFFRYRGWWYDTQEFERAGDDLQAMGWTGSSADSAWSGTLICQFDKEGEYLYESIIVGSAYWG